jgi:hypothetical protein
MKNSDISTIEYYEYMINTNKIIYVIGHTIGFVRIEINTCIAKILLFLFYTIIPTQKSYAKNYPTTMEFTRYKRYGLSRLQSLQRP